MITIYIKYSDNKNGSLEDLQLDLAPSTLQAILAAQRPVVGHHGDAVDDKPGSPDASVGSQSDDR